MKHPPMQLSISFCPGCGAVGAGGFSVHRAECSKPEPLNLVYEKTKLCANCDGSGLWGLEDCPRCFGTGQVRG